MSAAPKVPTVEVREHDDDIPFSVVVVRSHSSMVVHSTRRRSTADEIAAELRGALADAFCAGRAEAYYEEEHYGHGTECSVCGEEDV
jgi:hypothetical protein